MNENHETVGPKYYQDWLGLFSNITKSGITDKLYEQCINGKLEDRKYSLNNFKNELIKTINICLNNVINSYVKEIGLLFEFNDINTIILRTQNLKLKFKKIAFFNYLSFLDDSFLDELNKSFNENINDFYEMYLEKLKKQSIENDNIFELYYILKKYRY